MSSAKRHVHECVIERELDPSVDLHPATLAHAREHVALAEALSRKVEATLERGGSFPHTTFIGDADSGTRGLALALAADLGAPLIEACIGEVDDLSRLHRRLRSAAPGTVVLFDGPNNENHLAGFAIQRLHDGRRIWNPAWRACGTGPQEPWQERKLAERCYPPLVVITTETMEFRPLLHPFAHHGPDQPAANVQRVYVRRTEDAVRIQLARAIARRRLCIDDAAIGLIAARCHQRSIPLIDMVNALTEWCHAQPGAAVDESTASTVLDGLANFMVPPSSDRGRDRGFECSLDRSIDMDASSDSGTSSAASEHRQMVKLTAVLAGLLFVVISLACVTGLSIHSAVWGTDPAPPAAELVASP
ncbi:MAG: hypothetical protein RI990_134 [Planctomycetota bacterium]